MQRSQVGPEDIVTLGGVGSRALGSLEAAGELDRYWIRCQTPLLVSPSPVELQVTTLPLGASVSIREGTSGPLSLLGFF